LAEIAGADIAEVDNGGVDKRGDNEGTDFAELRRVAVSDLQAQGLKASAHVKVK